SIRQDLAAAAQARAERQRTRDPRVQGIERLDTHPSGRLEQLPFSRLVSFEDFSRRLLSYPVMLFLLRFAAFGIANRTDGAMAHFLCSFDRERDRHDLFRMVDFRQEPEVALDQQLGLP